MRKRSTILGELLQCILLGWGSLLLLAPLPLYWFIHGDTERYLWIIGGPSPFSSFGSGPFQLAMYVGLVASGSVFIAAGLFMRRRPKVDPVV
jgi:hypothetical protein